MKNDPILLILKYHKQNSERLKRLLVHSILVTHKAFLIAKNLEQKKEVKINWENLHFGAMIHDIGFGFPFLEEEENLRKQIKNCYVAHGFWGGKILKKEGLYQFVGFAENHIGVGISGQDIKKNQWPLPKKDYYPENIEEKIVSFADLFYSKKEASLFGEETREGVLGELGDYLDGKKKVQTFRCWEKELLMI